MSIRLHIEVCKKEGTDHFGSIGATCGLDLEIDQSALADPAAAVARIRGYYSFCETAMNEELARLRTSANGTPAPAAAVPPPAARQPAARTPVASAVPVPAEFEGAEDDLAEEDDPPNDGKHLLGWARNQPDDAKGWLIGLGKRLRYPNRILDWSPKQVDHAYRTYRQAYRS